MYELMPFRNDSIFNYFDNFEKNFWGNSERMVAAFKADVIDKGDKYLCLMRLK